MGWNSGCVYTCPDRSGYPDVWAPDRPSVYTKTIEVYAIRSYTLRYPELFENDFKGGSCGCPGSLWTRVDGASGYPDVTAHALCGFLRLESGFFLLSANFKTFLPSFLVLYQHNLILKVFHIHAASSSLKAISHALTADKFPVDPRHLLNAVFFSRLLNIPNKTLTLSSSQQTSKKKGKNGREFENMQLDEKKRHLRISPTHSEYAAYNASGYLDTCKRRKRFDPIRVDAPKISGSLRSGYPDIRIYLDTCKRSLRKGVSNLDGDLSVR